MSAAQFVSMEAAERMAAEAGRQALDRAVEEMTNYEREMGEFTAKVAAMEKDLSELKSDVRAIRDAMNQARGGWKAVALISGISGTLGAAIAKAIPFLMSLPR